MHGAHILEDLDVQSMRASSETDEELILHKIKKSKELQALILNRSQASWPPGRRGLAR